MGKQRDEGRMTKRDDKSYDREENKRAYHSSDSHKGKPTETVQQSEDHVGSSGAHGVRFKLPEDSEVCDHSKNVRDHLGA